MLKAKRNLSVSEMNSIKIFNDELIDQELFSAAADGEDVGSSGNSFKCTENDEEGFKNLHPPLDEPIERFQKLEGVATTSSVEGGISHICRARHLFLYARRKEGLFWSTC